MLFGTLKWDTLHNDSKYRIHEIIIITSSIYLIGRQGLYENETFI